MKYQLLINYILRQNVHFVFSFEPWVRNGIYNSIFHLEYKRIATKCPNVPKSDKISFTTLNPKSKNNPLFLTSEDF